MSRSNVEELKAELANLKESNLELFQKNVQPAIKAKIDKFLTAFEDYFRDRGFVVSKKGDTVRVSFDVLHFKAFSNENQGILIMKGKTQIATISVKYKGESSGYPSFQDFKGESTSRLEMEIEKEKRLVAYLVNPVVYYTGGDFESRFDDPFIILQSIFNV